MSVAVLNLDATKVAERMIKHIEAEGRGRECFYFRDTGEPLVQGGRSFGKLVRSGDHGTMDLQRSMRATFIVEYPFRPSLASCCDMVTEHEETGQRIVYDQARWEDDPRVDEQAGPSLTVDWTLEAMLNDLERKAA